MNYWSVSEMGPEERRWFIGIPSDFHFCCLLLSIPYRPDHDWEVKQFFKYLLSPDTLLFKVIADEVFFDSIS